MNAVSSVSRSVEQDWRHFAQETTSKAKLRRIKTIAYRGLSKS
jgi:hypothetical protein